MDARVPSVEWSLANLRAAGFAPRFAVDVGAYEGEWALMCQRVFPGVQVLMVEPQREMAGELERLVRATPGLTHAGVLLGAAPCDEVVFHQNANATASSVLADAAGGGHAAEVRLPMTTLADATRGTPFERPDFLKLDVQGYELEVLRGGVEQLRAAGVILLEVNLIGVYAGAPLLHETVAFLHGHGFVAYDIAGLFRRPLDNVLWQIDMIFVRADSPLVASKRWS